MSLFSVCEHPTYIEAREKLTLRDWTGSDSVLVHKMKLTGEWATGFSKDFGSVFIWKNYAYLVIIKIASQRTFSYKDIFSLDNLKSLN